jgi:uroporphyrinogen-III synthase
MRVALTQQHGRLENLQAALEARGHAVVRAPLIRTEMLSGADLSALHDCPWWVFTSSSAIEALHELRAFDDAPHQIAVVGRATARTLHDCTGRTATLVSPVETSLELAHHLVQTGVRGPFGWARGECALLRFKATLEAAGRVVRDVIVYRTVQQPLPQTALEAVVLASPSAVYALPLEVARTARLIALGPTTAAAARDRHLTVTTAREPTAYGVLEVLEQFNKETSHA